MKKFRFHLSSGQFITVQCEQVKIERGEDGTYIGYEIIGVASTKFVSFNLPHLVAIEQVT